MPIRELLHAGHFVAGWFHNPNIHPLSEYLRRREGAQTVARIHGIPLLFPDPDETLPGNAAEYGAEVWCRTALSHPDGRCAYCRESRFDAVARAAKALGYASFSSSLLYSRRQDHEGMKDAGEKAAARHGVSFLYRDFRPFWQEGIAASKELDIYRQQYCGCLFSEEERYANTLREAVAGGGLPPQTLPAEDVAPRISK